MSILIKGVEMPQSCWRCPLCLTVDPDTYRCIPTGQDFESTFDAIDHIVLSCPLVEVPPHGRLIDADAMKKSVIQQIDFLRLFGGKFNEIANVLGDGIMKEIDNAPTIIEAEVDDG